MKNLAQDGHNLANMFTELTRDKSLDESVEKAKQEQKMREQEEEMTEQNIKRISEGLLKLYEQKIYTIPQIADIFGLSIQEVRKILIITDFLKTRESKYFS